MKPGRSISRHKIPVSNEWKRSFDVVVLGAGNVGVATGMALMAKGGYAVHFADVNSSVVKSLRSQGYSAGLPATMPPAPVYFICVPTPTVTGRPDYSNLIHACEDLGTQMSPTTYQLVVIKSTVLPGATESIVIDQLQQSSGLKVGADFGVCMAPEYLRERYALFDALNPRLIVIGAYDTRSDDTLSQLFSCFSCPVVHTNIRTAETQKYIHNIFNATKIAFFNEMRCIVIKQGLDPETVFQATALSSEGMWNPEYGIRDWGAFGGACLPKDLAAFLTWAKDNSFHVRLLESVMEQNLSFIDLANGCYEDNG